MTINKALLEIVLDSIVLDSETRTCIQGLALLLGLSISELRILSSNEDKNIKIRWYNTVKVFKNTWALFVCKLLK